MIICLNLILVKIIPGMKVMFEFSFPVLSLFIFNLAALLLKLLHLVALLKPVSLLKHFVGRNFASAKTLTVLFLVY